MQAFLEFILSLISIDNIVSLEWIVKGPGLALIGWNLFKAVTSIFTFRIFSAFWGVVYAVAFAIILSNFGTQIQNMIIDEPSEETNEQVLLMQALPQDFQSKI